MIAPGEDDTDAVNVSQLRDALSNSEADSLSVKYDSELKEQVTFGGVSSTTPVKLKNVADGSIVAGSNEAVNGGQLYGITADITALSSDAHSLSNLTAAGQNAIKEYAQNAVEVVAGTNVTVASEDVGSVRKYTVSVEGSGTVAASDTGLIIGSTLYSEVRPAADGTYVKTANTTAANLTALDTQVKTNADAIATNTTNIATNAANIATNTETITANTTNIATNTTNIAALSADAHSLSNLSAAGQNVIKNYAQNAVEVVAGTNVSVSSADIEGVRKYTVNVGGTGSIASGNEGLVTGGTLYTELRPTADGTYVKTANTTAANLTALDTQVKANLDSITANTTAIETNATNISTNAANITAISNDAHSLSNLTAAGQNAIKEYALNAVEVVAGTNVTVTSADANDKRTYTVSVGGTGSIASGNEGLVTGGTLYTELRPTADGTYVKTANTTAANLTVLDTQVKANLDSITANTTAIETNATNISANTANITALSNDAHSLSNLTTAGQNMIKEYAQGAVGVVAGTNVTVTSADANDKRTYTVSVEGTGSIANGNEGLVTGGTLYTELRPTADGTYVKTASTTATNLTALDTQVKTNADAIATNTTNIATNTANIATNTETITANTTNIATNTTNIAVLSADAHSLSNLTTAGQNRIKEFAQNAVEVVAGTNVTVASEDIDNVHQYTVSVEGTGSIASDNKGLVTGGTLYTELRPASDGTYVKTANTTAANLTALDTQVKTNADAIATNTTNIATNTANIATNTETITANTTNIATNTTNIAALSADAHSLSNLSAAGQNVIKNYAQNAVEVVAGTNVSVSSADIEGVRKYTVNVEGIGSIASGNEGLVSGGTLYTELRPTADGTYVKTAKTTAANLTALDTQVKTNADAIATNTTNIATNTANIATNTENITTNTSNIATNTANITALSNDAHSLSNLTAVGQNAIKEYAQSAVEVVAGTNVTVASEDVGNVRQYTVSVEGTGTIANGDTGLVTGRTLYTELRPATDGTYVKTANTTATNLTALDTQVKTNADAIAANTTNIAANTADISTLSADANSLSTLTEAGKNVIKAHAKGAVNVVAGTNVTVSSADADGVRTFTVSATGNASAAGLTYDADTATITLDGTNGTKITNLADGSIAEGSTDAINGGQFWTQTHVNGGNYISSGNTVAQNLTSLDAQVKVNAGSIATNTTNISTLSADAYSLSNLTEAGENVIKAHAKGAVNVVAGTNVTVSSADADGVRTFTVNATVGDSAAGLTYDADTATITLEGTNGTKITNLADGSIVEGSTDAINGGQFWTQTHVNGGNFISSGNTVAQNLTSLDAQVKVNADGIAANTTNISTLSADAHSLSNLSAAGQNVIKNYAQNAVEVAAGTNVSVSSADVEGVRKYTVSVEGSGSIASGNEGLVNGGTLYTELRPATDGTYVKTANTTAANLTALDTQVKANLDSIAANTSAIETNATNISANTANITALSNDAHSLGNLTAAGQNRIKEYAQNAVEVVAGTNVSVASADAEGTRKYTVSVEGTGSIASGNEGLVTGGTLYTELRPATDGTYVKTANTTAANLTALDTQVKANLDSITANTTAIGTNETNISANTANITALSNDAHSLSNLTEAGQSVIKEYAQGAVEVVAGTNVTVTSADAEGTRKYTVSVEGTGSITSGNEGLITGGTLYTELRPATDGTYVKTAKTTAANLTALDTQVKANLDSITANATNISANTANITALSNDAHSLSNLTEAGENVIAAHARGAVNVVAGTNVSVSSADADGVRTFTVSATVGDSAAGLTYDASAATITLEGTNGTKITNLADGSIADCSTDAINGGQFWTQTHVNGGSYISAGNSVAQNFTSLDAQVQVNAGGIASNAENITKLTNLENITDSGKSVIRGLAKDSVKVIAGTNTTVTTGTYGVAKTYAVNVTAGGSIASGNTGLVSGGAVYAYVNENLSGVSDNVSGLSDQVSTLESAAIKYDGADKSKITLGGEDAAGPVTLANVKAGALSSNSKEAVNGAQLFTAGNSVANALGGDSSFDGATGTVNVSMTLNETEYTSLFDALVAVNDVASSAASGGEWNLAVNDGQSHTVKPKTTVTLRDDGTGDNLKIAQDGGTVTFAIKENPSFKGTVKAEGGFDANHKNIKNVAKGAVASDSEDAVNGSQLFDLGESAAAMLGGTTVFNKETGKVEQFSIAYHDGTTYNDVSSVLKAISSELNKSTTSALEVRDDTVTVKKKAVFSESVTVKKDLSVEGKATFNDIATFNRGINMNGSSITGLADGNVYQGSSNAVTGGEVYQLGKNFSDSMNEMNARLTKDIRNTGSRAAALSGLNPLPFSPGKPTGFNVAVGNYRGETSVAVGMSHYFNENAMLSVGSTMGHQPMANVGLALRLGRGSETIKASRSRENEQNARMAGMEQKLDAYRQENEQFRQENAELKRRLDRLEGVPEVKKTSAKEKRSQRTLDEKIDALLEKRGKKR